MTWFIEHIHADGRLISRKAMPAQQNSLSIGRALDNDVVLEDAYCAPYHAKLIVNDKGEAQLCAVNTINGIMQGRKRLQNMYFVANDKPYKLGRSYLRVRHSAWSIAPERPIKQQYDLMLGCIFAMLCVAYLALEVWVNDVEKHRPQYITILFWGVFVLALWSAVYSVYGRLVSGENRFFTHIKIASIGLLALSVSDDVINHLSYAMQWLWLLRIQFVISIVIVALAVRAHLRTADPHHWPTLRYAVAIVAALVIVVPTTQRWVSTGRLTTVDTQSRFVHPAFNWSPTVDRQTLEQGQLKLKELVDKDAQKPQSEAFENPFDSWFDE